MFLFGTIRDIGFFFFFSSRRRHTRWTGDWSSDVCSSDLGLRGGVGGDDLADAVEQGLEPFRQRMRRVGPDAAAGDVMKLAAGQVDDAETGHAQTRVDAEDADRLGHAGTAASAASSFSWTPPKAPLLMTGTLSPDRPAAATAATSVAKSSKTRALVPSGARIAAASQPRLAAWQKTRSASARLPGSNAFMTPSFMVLERGSSTARMRARSPRSRNPEIVAAIAVG